ncbi:hypothetical protein Pmani_007463 [Petrolisthes manimaculis]|uniref:Uncharacterized protein n=1 Tax=Petrolisthes manimaculis TaxID=1843537 RepID=A0AAE1Q8V8_9EUCA|nr:hypothetical protein Pmani_007463 [Petrolisthes manimaculis]
MVKLTVRVQLTFPDSNTIYRYIVTPYAERTNFHAGCPPTETTQRIYPGDNNTPAKGEFSNERLHDQGCTVRHTAAELTDIDFDEVNKQRSISELSVFAAAGPDHNGGNIRVGGNNFPLRGSKGGLYEGGTRGVAFIHSPLIPQTGFKYKGLMHVVDWFDTLLHIAGGRQIPNNPSSINPSNGTWGVDFGHQVNSATERNRTAPNTNRTEPVEARKMENSSRVRDSVDMWSAILENQPSPRTTFVYNLRKNPLRGAIR